MPTTRSPSSSADTSRTALLVVDMISCWEFPDADRLRPTARRIAPVIARLQQQCRRARVPVIFANDNNGRWRSDFRTQVDFALASTAGAAITAGIRPLEGDYFILKPKPSAFFATPLELLLKDLGTDHIFPTGVSTDQCVLATVAEARMRGFAVSVAADGTGSQTPSRHRRALLHLQEVMGVATPKAAAIRPRS